MDKDREGQRKLEGSGERCGGGGGGGGRRGATFLQSKGVKHL